MAKPRSSLISLSDTPYYHCIARCVRRGYLCGFDKLTQKNFDHRKLWLIERIKFLASVFCIDVAAYAIMSNHYHLVLRVNTDKAKLLTQDEVLKRWHCVCQPKPIIARYIKGEALPKSHQFVLDGCVADYRERLTSISWFMRFLNEFIARQANVEDNCKGHFWEGRFKSQALLDEVAVLACMTYVDLNPIRAKMADTPETSDFTSIQERLGIVPVMASTEQAKQTVNSKQSNSKATHPLNPVRNAELLPFVKSNQELAPNFKRDASHIPFSLIDYVELVDWTGHQIRQDKRGFIQSNIPSIVQRLGLTDESWLEFASTIETNFSHSIGQAVQLQHYAKAHQLKRVKGITKTKPRLQT
ncbi:transposase [Catenovulum adriaticum]|uniref:Transposase n=1 Tax=Catenovulum adriaticum TaxID=2984846 RepID=A0ABY7ASN0_9ALTE|nr:transposase [Catenovulum sp. TS8]WAJ72278.1 transposase [Catenovulum sp. TS8]